MPTSGPFLTLMELTEWESARACGWLIPMGVRNLLETKSSFCLMEKCKYFHITGKQNEKPSTSRSNSSDGAELMAVLTSLRPMICLKALAVAAQYIIALQL